MQVTATILAFSATLVGVMAGNLHVHNSCGFPVYCSSASNGEATSPSKIITGKSYKGAYAAQAVSSSTALHHLPLSLYPGKFRYRFSKEPICDTCHVLPSRAGPILGHSLMMR